MISGRFKHSKLSELKIEQVTCFSLGSPFLTKAESVTTLATNFPWVVVEEWFSLVLISAKVSKLLKLAISMNTASVS